MGRKHTPGLTEKKGSGITGDNLKVLKLGAVANDEYVYGMKDYPQWHGYFVTKSDKPINYVSCYIYLTRLAQAFSKGKLESLFSCQITNLMV